MPRGGVKPVLQDSDKVIKPDEVKLILDHTRKTDEQDYHIITGFLNTGLRNAELCALKVSDLRLDEQFPSIVVLGKKRKAGQIIKRNAETGEIKRREQDEPYEVLISDGYRNYLKKHIQAFKKKSERLVFQTIPGIVFNRNFVWKRIKMVYKQCGLSELYNVHALRHRFALNEFTRTYYNHLRHKPGDYSGATDHALMWVQKQLGHRNLDATRIYVRWFEMEACIEKRVAEKAFL